MRPSGYDDDVFSWGPPRRRATLSLAPLIDVTFILLIFFMLVSQFSRLAPIAVTVGQGALPPHSVPVSAGKGAPLTASLQLHVNGAFMVNGKHYDSSLGLAGAIDLINEYFDEQVQSRQGDVGDMRKVLLDADPGVPLQQIIDALEALQRQPDFSVTLVTAPEQPAGGARDRR